MAAPKNTQPFSVICLSRQDWRVDLPTNRQQIMSRAAEAGHEVLFIETGHFLGTHIFRLFADPRRRSLARRLLGTERVAERLRVRKALNLVPWGQRSSLASALNRRVTAWSVRRLARTLPRPVVLWAYDPCAPGPPGSYGEDILVYDCVDDYAEQAGGGARRALVSAADERVAVHSRLVFATTSPLYDRHRRLNSRTYLVPNVGDYEHFAAAADGTSAAPELARLPRPILGFAGNFLATKVDFDLLRNLAEARPEWTLLLVGPSSGKARSELDELRMLANVHWLGPKSYEELPRYVAAFDVGLIPYAANDYTRSCFPLKLYEYLAAGKPVVASGLPELDGMGPDVVLADGAASFMAAIESALDQGNGARDRRMSLAAGNTWEARTERLLGLISAELGG
jgi:glycosyltransferase involved in cell wall biosynthesis